MYNLNIEGLINSSDIEPTSYQGDNKYAEFLGITRLNIHFVDWYDKLGVRTGMQKGLFDHYFLFLLDDLDYIYCFDQPYGKREIGTVVDDWEVVYSSNKSLYSRDQIEGGAKAHTVIWRKDIRDYSLYKNKGEKATYPTTIVNVKLANTDRMFKRLVEWKH